MEARTGSIGKNRVNQSFNNILIIQTAFIGDVILALPMIQVLKKNYPNAIIDVVVVPKAAEIFSQHPAISRTIPYDKKNKDKGIAGFLRLRNALSLVKYDLIIVPHRSLRSALLSWMLKPKAIIGFDRSAGRWLFTNIVHYNAAEHEIDRNLSLLKPLGFSTIPNERPHLYPSSDDVYVIDSLSANLGLVKNSRVIAVAPGTIWNTKRWPADRFSALCQQLALEYSTIVLIGGKDDEDLCETIAARSGSNKVINVAGKLTLLQSAEFIRRCKLLISNDSAPMHLAVAVETPVIAIFGATIPEFGFAPRGENDSIVEIKGLECRPCSIHGGNSCPIKTFECMKAISPEMIMDKVRLSVKK